MSRERKMNWGEVPNMPSLGICYKKAKKGCDLTLIKLKLLAVCLAYNECLVNIAQRVNK